MFNNIFDDLLLESMDFGEEIVEGVELHTDEDGFVSAEVEIDESNVLDVDPFEFITEAMYQNIVNANNISMAILADNYRYLKENGVELVTEAEAAEKQKVSKKEAIVKFFKALKDKIVKFFETVLTKMLALQAKFRTLTKKAQERAQAGMEKLTKTTVPGYSLSDVESWAATQFDRLGRGEVDEFNKGNETKPSSFGDELNILKGYGKAISSVKKLRGKALKAINEEEKAELDRIKAFTAEDDDRKFKDKMADKKANHAPYTQRCNVIMQISRDAISLIMARVNASAKAVNTACKLGKGTGEKKEKAVNASYSFIESIEMI